MPGIISDTNVGMSSLEFVAITLIGFKYCRESICQGSIPIGHSVQLYCTTKIRDFMYI